MKRMILIVFLLFESQVLFCNEFISNNDTIELANDMYVHKKYAEALILYSNIYKKDSLNAIAIYRIGVCNFKLFNLMESNRYFLRSIKLNYRIVDSLFNMGLNYSSLGEYEFALTYFKLALKLSPNDMQIIHEIKIHEEKLNKKNDSD